MKRFTAADLQQQLGAFRDVGSLASSSASSSGTGRRVGYPKQALQRLVAKQTSRANVLGHGLGRSSESVDASGVGKPSSFSFGECYGKRRSASIELEMEEEEEEEEEEETHETHRQAIVLAKDEQRVLGTKKTTLVQQAGSLVRGPVVLRCKRLHAGTCLAWHGWVERRVDGKVVGEVSTAVMEWIAPLLESDMIACQCLIPQSQSRQRGLALEITVVQMRSVGSGVMMALQGTNTRSSSGCHTSMTYPSLLKAWQGLCQALIISSSALYSTASLLEQRRSASLKKKASVSTKRVKSNQWSSSSSSSSSSSLLSSHSKTKTEMKSSTPMFSLNSLRKNKIAANGKGKNTTLFKLHLGVSNNDETAAATPTVAAATAAVAARGEYDETTNDALHDLNWLMDQEAADDIVIENQQAALERALFGEEHQHAAAAGIAEGEALVVRFGGEWKKDQETVKEDASWMWNDDRDIPPPMPPPPFRRCGPSSTLNLKPRSMLRAGRIRACPAHMPSSKMLERHNHHNRQGLSPCVKVCYTSTGARYYVNVLTNRTYWSLPQVDESRKMEPTRQPRLVDVKSSPKRAKVVMEHGKTSKMVWVQLVRKTRAKGRTTIIVCPRRRDFDQWRMAFAASAATTSTPIASGGDLSVFFDDGLPLPRRKNSTRGGDGDKWSSFDVVVTYVGGNADSGGSGSTSEDEGDDDIAEAEAATREDIEDDDVEGDGGKVGGKSGREWDAARALTLLQRPTLPAVESLATSSVDDSIDDMEGVDDDIDFCDGAANADSRAKRMDTTEPKEWYRVIYDRAHILTKQQLHKMGKAWPAWHSWCLASGKTSLSNKTARAMCVAQDKHVPNERFAVSGRDPHQPTTPKVTKNRCCKGADVREWKIVRV